MHVLVFKIVTEKIGKIRTCRSTLRDTFNQSKEESSNVNEVISYRKWDDCLAKVLQCHVKDFISGELRPMSLALSGGPGGVRAGGASIVASLRTVQRREVACGLSRTEGVTSSLNSYGET